LLFSVKLRQSAFGSDLIEGEENWICRNVMVVGRVGLVRMRPVDKTTGELAWGVAMLHQQKTSDKTIIPNFQPGV
jgi:hypothetical protein